MEPVRVGIVGCGLIAFMKHMPALKKCGALMIAFYDAKIENAQRALDQFGAPGARAYDTLDGLLQNRDAEAVYILTPNRFHCEQSVLALKAGKHVMCEKPMALGAAEAKQMLDARDESGTLLTVGYQNRQLPESIYLKKECESGTLGDIYYARARALRRRGVPTWGNFFSRSSQGGGALIDIATHALDLTLYLMNNFEPVYCAGTTYSAFSHAVQPGNHWGDWDGRSYDVEDAAFGFVVMKNGATVCLEASWALNTLETGDCRTVLCGTKGGADTLDGLRLNGVSHNTQYILKPDFTATGVAPFEQKRTEDDRECEIFLKAVRGEGKLCVLPEQAAAVARILEGVYLSAQSGKPHMFSDVQ